MVTICIDSFYKRGIVFLTFANGCIIVLGLVLTWCILFSIFDEKSSRRLGIKLGILVLFLSPFIAKLSYDFYENGVYGEKMLR